MTVVDTMPMVDMEVSGTDGWAIFSVWSSIGVALLPLVPRAPKKLTTDFTVFARKDYDRCVSAR